MAQPLRVSGDLRDLDSAWLLRSLAGSRETGRLALSDCGVTRTLFFRGGDLIFAASSEREEGLGPWLVRAGRLSTLGYERAAREVHPDRRLGTVLVEEGLLRPEELVTAVTEQLLAIARAVVLAERGRYLFDFTDVLLREMILLRHDVREVLLVALRGVVSVGRVLAALDGLANRTLGRAAEPLPSVPLERVEEDVLGAFGDGRSVDDLPEIPGSSSWEVARAVFALEAAGLLAPRVRPPLAVEPAAAEAAGSA